MCSGTTRQLSYHRRKDSSYWETTESSFFSPISLLLKGVKTQSWAPLLQINSQGGRLTANLLQ